jgi:hypothetical protein
MAKVKDLGINVIPETMRPQECLPWTVGPVCIPGGITRDAGAAELQANAPIQITLVTYNGCCWHGTWCGYLSPCGWGTITNCGWGTITNCGIISTCALHTIHCPGGSICTAATHTITITPTTPVIQPGTLSRESITALREQLQQHLESLDAHVKTLDDQDKKKSK